MGKYCLTNCGSAERRRIAAQAPCGHLLVAGSIQAARIAASARQSFLLFFSLLIPSCLKTSPGDSIQKGGNALVRGGLKFEGNQYSKPAILPAAPPASQHPNPVVRGYLCLFRGFAGFCPTTHSTWDMRRKSKAQSTKLGDLWHPPLPAVVDPVQNPKKALREAKTAAMEKDPHHASSPRGQRFSIHHTLARCHRRRRSKIN